MGRHSRVAELRALAKSAGGDISGRHTRSRWSLPLFATATTFAFVLVIIAPPATPDSAFAEVVEQPADASQSVSLDGRYASASVARDAFGVTAAPPPPPPAPVFVAPAAGVPDPGTAQAVAYAMLQARGQGDDQFGCLVALWDRESNWNVYAANPSSGAYGIPQSLPGEKMASAGADWQTNPATQISWGLGYIDSRYGSPCGAWAFSEENGWY